MSARTHLTRPKFQVAGVNRAQVFADSEIGLKLGRVCLGANSVSDIPRSLLCQNLRPLFQVALSYSRSEKSRDEGRRCKLVDSG